MHERKLEKEVSKREVKKEDIVIFRSPYEEQKWRLSKLMEDPVTRCGHGICHTHTYIYIDICIYIYRESGLCVRRESVCVRV